MINTVSLMILRMPCRTLPTYLKSVINIDYATYSSKQLPVLHIIIAYILKQEKLNSDNLNKDIL